MLDASFPSFSSRCSFYDRSSFIPSLLSHVSPEDAFENEAFHAFVSSRGSNARDALRISMHCELNETLASRHSPSGSGERVV